MILSFFAGEESGPWFFVLGIRLALAVAAFIGFLNGFLIRIVKLSPLITTLAMFIALQGVSLMLRSTPDGFFAPLDHADPDNAFWSVAGGVHRSCGHGDFARACAAANALRHGDLRHRVERSGGLSPGRAGQPQLHSRLYTLFFFRSFGRRFALCAIGVGDPTVGQNYTLQSISAVVLGGASIFGGRGSFLGALAGVILVQEITATTGFLGLGTAWQYWLPGILILAATAMYSRTRSVGAH